MFLREFVHDLVEAIKDWRFWWTFGLNDARRVYMRTRFGIAWEIVGPALFVYCVGFAYTRLLDYDLSTFLPHICLGYIIWLNMQFIVNEGCFNLIRADMLLLSNPRPILSLSLRRFVNSAIYSSVHVVILVPILVLLFPVFTSISLFHLLYFLFVYVLAALSLLVVLSVACLRFRDLAPLIAALNRLAFFVTPIIWTEKNLGSAGQFITNINPYSYFLGGLRSSILGLPITGSDMLLPLIIALALMIVAIILLDHFKQRVPFWL